MLRTPYRFTVLRKEIAARTRSGSLPIYLVNEYPKCGGSWLREMLSMALGLPQWSREAPVWGPCVMHGHWLRPEGLRNVVALHRDGRDIMVSWYYHCFFLNERMNAPLVRRMRARFGFADVEDIRANLLPFMQAMLTDPPAPRMTWPGFVRRWHGRPGVVETRYEALRADTAGELARVVGRLTGKALAPDRAAGIAEACSMARMREREALRPRTQVAERSFIRKGAVGGWSPHFTDEALAFFEARAGDALDRLGYPRGRPG